MIFVSLEKPSPDKTALRFSISNIETKQNTKDAVPNQYQSRHGRLRCDLLSNV
jgi:hypothetical protein